MQYTKMKLLTNPSLPTLISPLYCTLRRTRISLLQKTRVKANFDSRSSHLVNSTVLFTYLRCFHQIKWDAFGESMGVFANVFMTFAISYQWVRYIRLRVDAGSSLRVRIQHPENIDVCVDICKKYIILESRNCCKNLVQCLVDLIGFKPLVKRSILVLNHERLIDPEMTLEEDLDNFLLNVSAIRLIFYD